MIEVDFFIDKIIEELKVKRGIKKEGKPLVRFLY